MGIYDRVANEQEAGAIRNSPTRYDLLRPTGSSAIFASIEDWLATLGGGALYVGDTPPPFPAFRQLWWETDSGQLYVWYDDGTGSQWVSVVGGSLTTVFAPAGPAHAAGSVPDPGAAVPESYGQHKFLGEDAVFAQPVPAVAYARSLDGFNYTNTADNRTPLANMMAAVPPGRTLQFLNGIMRFDGPVILDKPNLDFIGAPAGGVGTIWNRNFNGGTEAAALANYGFVQPRATIASFKHIYLNAAPDTTGGTGIFIIGFTDRSADYSFFEDVTVSGFGVTVPGGSARGSWSSGFYSSGLAKTLGNPFGPGNRDIKVVGLFVSLATEFSMKLISTKAFIGERLNLVGVGASQYGKVVINGDVSASIGSELLMLSGPQLGDFDIGETIGAVINTASAHDVFFRGTQIYGVQMTLGGSLGTITNGFQTQGQTRINGVLQGS